MAWFVKVVDHNKDLKDTLNADLDRWYAGPFRTQCDAHEFAVARMDMARSSRVIAARFCEVVNYRPR